MGDEGRVWLTYEEAGKALRIKAASAKRLSFRRSWPHRAGNDGLARVGVPVTELRRATGDATGDTPRAALGDDSGTIPRDAPGDATGGVTGDKPDGSAALALALDRIEALAGQVGHARAEVAHLRGELAEAGRRAAEAEGAALDAWRTAAELANRLAPIQPPTGLVRHPPRAPRRRGFVARLLGR